MLFLTSFLAAGIVEELAREFGQDYRHHNHRDSEYFAIRTVFHLTEELMLGPTYAPTLAIAWRRARILLPRSSVRALVFVVPLLFPPLSPLTVSAQDSEDDVVRVSTDLLLFPIRIRDKKSQTVSDFSEKDLSLKDPDGITSGLYFSAGVDRVALVFAVDQSGSLREIVAQQRSAAVALFSRFSDRSSIAVIRFSETPELAAPFNTDPAAAKAAFELPAARDRNTAIFDAAAKSISTFDALQRVRGERRIVILISDGLDNVSRARPNDIINRAVENNVSFYIIHLPLFEPRDGRLAIRTPTKGFRDLAEKTGGSYFLVGDTKAALSPTKTQDLTPVFNAIEEDLRSQYLVGFYIAEGARKGGTHRVSINVTRPGVTYSFGRYGYAKSHNFVVNLTPRKRN